MDLTNKKHIMPFVNLYKSAFDNIDEIYEVIKNSVDDSSGKVIANWEPWYELGIKSNFKIPEESIYDENYDTSHLNEFGLKQYKVFKQIKNTLDAAYEDFFQEWGTKEKILEYTNSEVYWDDWKQVFSEFVTNWNFKEILKGNDRSIDGWVGSEIEVLRHNKETNKKFAINYHLDAFGSQFSAGPKAIATSTIYLNDDFEGGQVSYLDEFNNLIVNYKPQKGDLIVFPSYKPFFHAALPLSKNYKYFVRNFLIWNHGGSEEYKEMLKEFGPELMEKFEEYRHKVESSLGYFQKNVYMPGEDIFEKNRDTENGMTFFVKRVVDWNKENE